LLIFVFGLSPAKDDQDYEVVYPENRVASKTNTNIAKTSSNVYVNGNNNNNNNDNDNNNSGTTADDYDPNDYSSGTPSDINNYN